MEANKKFLGWFRWMSLIVLASSSIILFLAAKPQSDKFSKYKAVEAYEIRPGILMMPRYAEDGQVCEIELERLHFAHETINVDSQLLRKDVDEIANELVPVSERGPQPKNLLEQGMTLFLGNSMETNEEYENISIQIFGTLSTSSSHEMVGEDVAATITWKNRKCQ
jgi:hypothetical protein